MRELRLNAKEHEKFVWLMDRRLFSRNMSLDDLANALEVSRQSIYNYRNDSSRNPSKYLGAKIATYLEITLGDIRGECNE